MTTTTTPTARPVQTVPVEPLSDAPPDPLLLLKGLGTLRRLTGMYPSGHPMIAQKLVELDEIVRRPLRTAPALCIDIIHGDVYLDGVSFRHDSQANAQMIRELIDLGVHSIHIQRGVESRELYAVAEFLWQLKEGTSDEPIVTRLAQRRVRHISLGRIVPLDTRWRAQQWPEAPTGPLDPAYAQSLLLAQEAWETVAAGRDLDPFTVRDLVQFLIYKVARSNAALGQILAVKQYENLTYCHSVNVAMLSLLLGQRLAFDEPTMAALVEAALLHDIGKTRVPLEIVKKPGALDKRERKLIEAHTTIGSEILVEIDGLRPLTPTVALEHHRTVRGGGYPDLGEGIVPHALSQLVSVADVYEALTGARSYQIPTLPEQACLVLARIAGEQLNTSLVKTFVNTITFFPLGSLVRTDRNEVGVVIRTNTADPLHPVVAVMNEGADGPEREIDTSARDTAGAYERHIVETLAPKEGELDLTKFLAPEPIAI
jgi:putative nucleotidyltransferase with HDIG domain